jgi:hypothetical protein
MRFGTFGAKQLCFQNLVASGCFEICLNFVHHARIVSKAEDRYPLPLQNNHFFRNKELT